MGPSTLPPTGRSLRPPAAPVCPRTGRSLDRRTPPGRVCTRGPLLTATRGFEIRESLMEKLEAKLNGGNSAASRAQYLVQPEDNGIRANQPP
jgi:hypothetical protein